MSRRIGRILSFMALYAWDALGQESNDREGIKETLTFSFLEPVELENGEMLVSEVENSISDTTNFKAATETAERHYLEKNTKETLDSLYSNLLSLEGLVFSRLPESTKTETFTFARLLFAGAIENIAQIDGAIKSHLSRNWKFERLDRVTLAVLRLGAYELVFKKETEKAVVINEAVDIAKEFTTDDLYRFVNAVLENIARDNLS